MGVSVGVDGNLAVWALNRFTNGFTFAFERHVHSCRRRFAGVTIGFAVATTHRIVNQDTRLGSGSTFAQSFTVTGYFLTVVVCCTLRVVFATYRFAGVVTSIAVGIGRKVAGGAFDGDGAYTGVVATVAICVDCDLL